MRSAGARSSGRLSTVQRVNGACCQSISNAEPKDATFSPTPAPAMSTTQVALAAVATKCPSFVSKMRPSAAACGEDAVRKTTFGDRRIIARRAQPPAQPAQHLVADETHHGGHPRLAGALAAGLAIPPLIGVTQNETASADAPPRAPRTPRSLRFRSETRAAPAPLPPRGWTPASCGRRTLRGWPRNLRGDGCR
jgi:hypothetical protein